MARKGGNKKDITSYDHKGKTRTNNPPAGLVTEETDPDKSKTTYQHDPHLDPQLQWAGKTERTSFEVPTQSLHVHERIDPCTIIEAVRKRNGNGYTQASLFEEEQLPLHQAIEFYKHSKNWSNRLIAGDSLLVMNSLLQKENMAGKVQCVYIDPPYGIKYGSNFQPFVGKREVKDGKDEDLTSEPEMIKAFRDTWELGIHSYLSYMRDRLLLAKDLLTESGSCFVQISDENVHHIREIMDEVFGGGNFVHLIAFQKTGYLGGKTLDATYDYLIWYAKNKQQLKFRMLFEERSKNSLERYNYVEKNDGTSIKLTKSQIAGYESVPDGRRWRDKSLFADGETKGESSKPFKFDGRMFKPSVGKHWSTSVSGLKRLKDVNRIVLFKDRICFKSYVDDFPLVQKGVVWTGMMVGRQLDYVVETSKKVIQNCILMTTDPGDLVFDPTCGSGTTAYVAEQWGRRWITCDTSRVATTLAKQRLMTASFDYYKLAYPDEGVGSGFEYEKVPHITLKSIANDEPHATETLFDKPIKDTKRARVTGPFTVEAVPSPTVQPIDNIKTPATPADETVTRSGETLRQSEWRDELLKTGIRGKSGQRISFSRVEPLPCHWLHAEAETKPDESGKDAVREAATAHTPRRVVISFGPEHAPLEQRQVENALQEAAKLMPKPEIIVFAAFQFDPEAAKDIDEVNWPGMTILKVQMNADMQTEDLKKKRSSSESFWLIGQPEVEVEQIRKGDLSGQWQVHMNGFDYFNTRTGKLESGDEKRVAVWMLDTDYDGRSLYPSQVFFPMANEKDGWTKLAKNLKAEIDEGLIESYKGTTSLPFELGKNHRIAVKIVDDRGIESLKVVEIKETKHE